MLPSRTWSNNVFKVIVFFHLHIEWHSLSAQGQCGHYLFQKRNCFTISYFCFVSESSFFCIHHWSCNPTDFARPLTISFFFFRWDFSRAVRLKPVEFYMFWLLKVKQHCFFAFSSFFFCWYNACLALSLLCFSFSSKTDILAFWFRLRVSVFHFPFFSILQGPFVFHAAFEDTFFQQQILESFLLIYP